MTNEPIKIDGYAILILRDAKTGKVIQKGKTKNLICTAGFDDAFRRNMIVDNDGFLSGSGTNWAAGVAIGSDDTAPTAADTDLGAIVAARGIEPGSVNANTTKRIRFTSRFGTDVTGTIKEVGIYSNDMSGGLYSVSVAEPADGDAIISLTDEYIGSVFFICGIKIADGEQDPYELDTDFEFSTDRTSLLAVGDKTGYYVVAHYTKVNKASLGGSLLLTHALTDAVYSKTATNILDVIYVLTLA